MPKGQFPRKKKDQFADLPEDFKTLIEGGDAAVCKSKLAEVGLAQNTLDEAKKNDQDLAEKAESFREAGSVYRDGSKMNKLKTKYIAQRLKDLGKA